VLSAGSHKAGRRPAVLTLLQDGVNWIFRASILGIGVFLHVQCLCASYASAPPHAWNLNPQPRQSHDPPVSALVGEVSWHFSGWIEIGGTLSSSQNQPGATSGALYGNAPYLYAQQPTAINLHQFDLHAIRLPDTYQTDRIRLGLSCRCALRHGLPLPYDEAPSSLRAAT